MALDLYTKTLSTTPQPHPARTTWRNIYGQGQLQPMIPCCVHVVVMLPSERVYPFQWDCTAGVGGGGEGEKGRVEMVSVYNWLGLLYCWTKSLLSAGTFSPIAVLKIYLPKGQVVTAFSVVRPKIYLSRAIGRVGISSPALIPYSNTTRSKLKALNTCRLFSPTSPFSSPLPFWGVFEKLLTISNITYLANTDVNLHSQSEQIWKMTDTL